MTPEEREAYINCYMVGEYAVDELLSVHIFSDEQSCDMFTDFLNRTVPYPEVGYSGKITSMYLQ